MEIKEDLEKENFDNLTNKIKISLKKSKEFYFNLTLVTLARFEKIQFEGLGNSATLLIELIEKLKR